MSEWTKEEIDFIKENYNKYTKHQLSEILGKSKGAIQQKANRMGIKKKSVYFYNKNFFKKIHTEQQAYWLGFIFADGWITDYELGIELNENDDKHLRKFNKDISGNLAIKYRSHKPTIIKGKNVGIRRTCVLKIFSKEIVNDLIGHGCLKNKSMLIEKPKDIPNEFLKDFIRGYFDGNGYIGINKISLKSDTKDYLRVSINSGSFKFIEWLSFYLNNININNYIIKDEDNNNYSVYICSESLTKFLNYIYDKSTVYLDRKYNKYKNLVDDCKVVM